MIGICETAQAEAAAEARVLKSELVRGLRVQDEQVYLDSDNLTDLRELLDAVRASDVVVLMLTDAVLSRSWCLAELDTAVKANIPIVVLQVSAHHLPSMELTTRLKPRTADQQFVQEVAGTHPSRACRLAEVPGREEYKRTDSAGRHPHGSS